jgi:hypothetical protein
MGITKEQVDKAINANVIVYDQHSLKGDISPRLIILMLNVARNLGYGRCVKIHYPHHKKEWVESETKEHGGIDTKGEKHFWGFDFEFIPFDLIQYYDYQSCAYGPGKGDLLVAEFEHGDFLMGSF